MSLTTRQYNKQNNSRRRYILQPPTIHSTTIPNSNNYQQQIKRPFYSKNEKYLFNSVNNENINDPWVKELLQRDIDFSKFDEKEEEEVQLLNIQLNKSNDFEKRFESPLIIKSHSESKFYFTRF